MIEKKQVWHLFSDATNSGVKQVPEVIQNILFSGFSRLHNLQNRRTSSRYRGIATRIIAGPLSMKNE